jgi:hypothetical protein
MMTDLSIRCRCGAVRGVLAGSGIKSGNRVVCYCDDCQAFADFLSTDQGILDSHGGTDIFQASSTYLKFTSGAEHLACVKVTPKGGLRWFTNCCRTPVGNTPPTIKLPFVGLIHSCLDPEGRPLDEVIGPVRMRVMGQYARGDAADLHIHRRFPPWLILSMIWKLLWWRLRGGYRDTPFFDADSGRPVSTPRLIRDITQAGG